LEKGPEILGRKHLFERLEKHRDIIRKFSEALLGNQVSDCPCEFGFIEEGGVRVVALARVVVRVGVSSAFVLAFTEFLFDE
jgi:hypothetical protein